MDIAPVCASSGPSLEEAAGSAVGTVVVPGEAWSLSSSNGHSRILSDAGVVFSHGSGMQGIVAGVAGVLVSHLCDWCLVVRRVEGPDLTPVVLSVRAGLDDPPDLAGGALVADRGIGLRLARAVECWGGREPLSLEGPQGAVECPARAWGVLPLGSGRLRFGALAVGRVGEEATEFTLEERDLLRALADRTAAALENAELVRSAMRSARARDTVVDVVVHDLATPLNSLELLVERMSATAEPEVHEHVRRHAEAARRSLAQIRNLVADLSDIRDIEQGMFTARLTTQSICDILTAAEDRVAETAQAQGVAVRVERDACPLRIMADPERIVRLLGHLLTNAIRVTPRGGTVTLRPVRAGDRAEVSVIDEGPGIPARLLPHLFDRFARARGHDGGRRGLGLMIAQEIARAHGEPLRVETSPGGGSRFTFSLALAPPAPGGAAARP